MLNKFDYKSRPFLYFTIFTLVLLNILVKISYLDFEPFWFDESISIKVSFVPFGHIKHESDWDNNPPFYYYCIWAWIKLFGISEFKVRLLSVLFSSLSAAALFAFSKKFFTYATSLSAALLFTFHNYSYEYSHEARSYSLVILLVILSAILFFKFLEKPNYLNVILLGLVNFLIVYTHYLAAITLFLQFVFLLIFYRPKFKLFSIALVIPILLVLLRFTKKQYLTIFGFNKSGKSFWLQKSDFSLFTETVEKLSGDNKLSLIILSFILFATIYVLLKRDFKKLIQRHILLYCIFIGIMSFILLFAIGKFTPVFHSRYLVFTIPFLILLVSWFITATRKWLIFLIPILIGLEFFYLVPNPQKPMDFRTTAVVARKLYLSNTKPLIILQTRDITELFTYYFSRPLYMDYWHLKQNINKCKIYDIATANDLNSINFKDRNTIIFCQTYENGEESKLVFDTFKANGFVYSTCNLVKGTKISLLKRIKS